MEKFRIGNDLTVFWAILDDDSQPYDLSGRTVKIFLTHPRGRMEITEDVNIQGNVISWLFRGRQQRYLGVYKLTVEIFSSPSTRVLRRDIDQAFSLVSATLYVEESNGRPQINETGKLTLSTILEVYQIMPIVPQVGPNKNWWVDGVDTGKPSTGMSAYEFAKENGYTGTEAEYAAECLAVPVLNEESRTATSKATTVTEGAIAQLQAVSSYMAEVAAPTIAKAEQATTEATAAAENAADSASRAENEADRVERGLSQLSSYMSETVSPAVQSANNAAEEATAAAGDANVAAETANDAATTAGTATQKANKAASDATNAAGTANSAAEAANAAATRAERAIEAFGPAIDNKADLENGKIIASQLPDYILGQVMFGGLIYSNGTITASSNFISKYGNDTNISASEASKYNGVYFIVTGDAVNVTIAGVSQVSTGDWIISVGDSWKKIDNSDAVTSVAGLVGNVNASSLAAALAELADSNSLARKTDLPKKLSELEIDIEIESDNSEIKEILSTIVDEEGYLYSNGEKVDMRFTRSLLPVGTAIPANANLNSKAYLKIGKYYCSLNVDAKTITNCPTSEAFSMEVFNPLGTNVDDEDTREYTYRLRVLTAYKTGVQYIQYCATSGTAGSWTYNSWFVVPRTSFSLASNKNGGSAAKGASNRGVYIDSTGTFQQMGYTVGKSVPSNAVFTDTNTKVTAVENHYAPAEDEDQQIDAPDGEVVTGLKRDAAGHVVGVVSVPQSEGGSYDDTAIRNELSKKLESEVVGTTEPTEDFEVNAEIKAQLAELSAEIEEKSEVSLETLANGNLKVTIDGVSKDFMAATPSGDPMHYNYITVGAEYNDTDAPIAKTDYFGNAVSHLPGRWYVEGLGDLTNAEMREVYEAGKWWENSDNRGFGSHIGARAILRCPAYEQVFYKGDFNFIQAFNYNPNMEVVNLSTHPQQLGEPLFNRIKINYFDFGCQGSPKIKCIYGIIDATATSGDSSYWLHTAGLIEVRLYNIKVGIKFPLAKNISKASILYMIENEASTKAIAITLHADAYARLSADADIVAALAAHPNVSLAKA